MEGANKDGVRTGEGDFFRLAPPPSIFDIYIGQLWISMTYIVLLIVLYDNRLMMQQ